MTKLKLGVGFHANTPCHCDGIGDYLQKLASNGHMIAAKSVDSTASLMDYQQLRDQGHDGVGVFRCLAWKNADPPPGWHTPRDQDVPPYGADPKKTALVYRDKLRAAWPPEMKKQYFYVEMINECDKNQSDWLGNFMVELGKLLMADGFKFAGPSWSGGEPEPEHNRTPGMLEWFRLIEKHPDQLAHSVHEYTFDSGKTMQDSMPWLMGRCQDVNSACLESGITPPPILITEWGWGADDAPKWHTGSPQIIKEGGMIEWYLENVPNVKAVFLWALDKDVKWGDLADVINPYMTPLSNNIVNREPWPPPADIEEPDKPQEQPPPPVVDTPPVVEPPIDKPASELFSLQFTGLGEKDVGIKKAGWYDLGNVQVPIINGRKMDFWSAAGKNIFGDGKPWNDFAPLEGVFRWDTHLPEREHYFLNDKGRCYHLFGPAMASWARFSYKVHLEPGTYRLELDLWGDWVDIKKGKKVPKPDPGHARVELFLSDQGQKDWIRPEYNAQSVLKREIRVEHSGEYDVGFGVLTVFAPGGGPGANGCFLRSFKLERVEVEAPPKPKAKEIKEEVDQPAADERVLGMDVSYAQGFDVDFASAAEAGVRFCFIRAGSGQTEVDANYEHNYTQAGMAGMLRGIYYYLYPESAALVGEDADRTPEGQAQRFIGLLKDDAELGAVLDVEDKRLTPEEVKRFVDEFQKGDPYDRPITIYTAAWFWNSSRGFSGSDVDWAAEHPLWVAAYPSSKKLIVPTDEYKVPFPDTWKKHLIHQWTAIGGPMAGQEKQGLDLNYFIGSVSALEEWARSGLVTEPKPPTVVNTKYVTSEVGLRMRSGPSTADEIISVLKYGTAVEVIKEGAWDQIRAGGVMGYSSSKFLSETKPTEVESPGTEPGHAEGEFQFKVWPTVEKRVTQHFGKNPEFYKKFDLPGHEGIDLASPLGSPYYCVAPGTVTRVTDKRLDGKPSAYGWHVVVDHGSGYSTLYAHAGEDILVSADDKVLAGQILAHSGNTGNTSGPHLHLTLKKKGFQLAGWPPKYMDPWLFLEPLFNKIRPPIGDLVEGYLWGALLENRGDQLALTKGNLHLREKADSDSKILAIVPKGRTVRLLGESLENGYFLCEVSFDPNAQPKKIREQPKKDTIDLLLYVKGDGRQYEVRNSFGSQERFQTQEDGSTFYLVKNTQWEQFFFDNDFIYRDIDISPGAGRYYRLTDPDRQHGSRWLRRRMVIGDTFTQKRHVQFYNKKDGTPSVPNSGHVEDTIKLVAHHDKLKFETGVEVEDVIEFQWVNGKEKYFYARGLGMVGWARGHDDPNTPEWSAVAEIHAPGSREPFVRERVIII